MNLYVFVSHNASLTFFKSSIYIVQLLTLNDPLLVGFWSVTSVLLCTRLTHGDCSPCRT